MYIQKPNRPRRIFAADAEDFDEIVERDIKDDGIADDVIIAPEAEAILFETEDVAELVADIVEDTVEVSTDLDTGEVVFAVGDDEYTVIPDEDAEYVSSSRRIARRNRIHASSSRQPQRSPRVHRPVSAATRRPSSRPGTSHRSSRTPVQASRKTRVVKRYSK